MAGRLSGLAFIKSSYRIQAYIAAYEGAAKDLVDARGQNHDLKDQVIVIDRLPLIVFFLIVFFLLAMISPFGLTLR